MQLHNLLIFNQIFMIRINDISVVKFKIVENMFTKNGNQKDKKTIPINLYVFMF
jgi:hypothetical protein